MAQIAFLVKSHVNDLILSKGTVEQTTETMRNAPPPPPPPPPSQKTKTAATLGGE